MSYKDKTFCPKSDKDNHKCVQCDRYFDKAEYDRISEKNGWKEPICWFLEPPCGDKDKENFVVNLKKESEEK